MYIGTIKLLCLCTARCFPHYQYGEMTILPQRHAQQSESVTSSSRLSRGLFGFGAVCAFLSFRDDMFDSLRVRAAHRRQAKSVDTLVARNKFVGEGKPGHA